MSLKGGMGIILHRLGPGKKITEPFSEASPATLFLENDFSNLVAWVVNATKRGWVCGGFPGEEAFCCSDFLGGGFKHFFFQPYLGKIHPF